VSPARTGRPCVETPVIGSEIEKSWTSRKPIRRIGVYVYMMAAETKVYLFVEGAIDEADQVSLASLHQRHYSAMVRLALIYVDDTGSAEEVVQDAFLKMHRGRRKPKPGRELSYLRAAVMNGARSRLRRRQVVRAKQPHLRVVEVESSELSAMRRSDQDHLWAAVMELPKKQSAVLVLRYYENLSEAEIAEALGIAKGSVKSHAHRALRNLEKKLGAQR